MKLYKNFELLSYWFRYQATYLEMKYHFKKVLKGKEDSYIKKIHHYDRNIGKSAALARLSVKYDIPIVVPNQSWKCNVEKDIPKYIPKYFKKNKPNAIVVNNSLMNKRYKILLLEERLTRDQINIANRMCNGAVVGYTNFD